MNRKQWIIKKVPILCVIGVIIGFGAWPFIKHPPSHRNDKRTLLQLHAQTRSDIQAGNIPLEGRSGIVLYHEKQILESESCDCPFLWKTKPLSGEQIQILDLRKHDRDNPPTDFAVKFYVVAQDADWFGGRWVLFNRGEPKYVKDSRIDWNSQTVGD